MKDAVIDPVGPDEASTAVDLDLMDQRVPPLALLGLLQGIGMLVDPGSSAEPFAN